LIVLLFYAELFTALTECVVLVADDEADVSNKE